MSRFISEILDIPQTSLALQIERLERLSGRPGLDNKLANELALIFKEKAGEAGLDQNDTRPQELYFAMHRLIFEHSEKLAKIIGITSKDPPRRMVEKSVKFVEKRLGAKTVWSLKPSVARRQLKQNPPKKLMKTLGIRSIDSALKRESVSLFYCFARLMEPPVWFGKYAAQAAKLTNSDFDNNRLSIDIIDQKRHDQLAKAGLRLNQVIFADQESAGIQICVPEKRFSGDTLFVVDSLLLQIRNMLRWAEYYRFQGLRPEFFAKVEKIRLAGFRAVEHDNYPFDWHTLAHAASELGIGGLVQSDESFLSPEDLIVPSLPTLAGLDFWKHPYALYGETGNIVSFNLSDMIINAVNRLPIKRAYLNNGRHTLKNELFARYLHNEPVRLQAIDPKGTD